MRPYLGVLCLKASKSKTLSYVAEFGLLDLAAPLQPVKWARSKE